MKTFKVSSEKSSHLGNNNIDCNQGANYILKELKGSDNKVMPNLEDEDNSITKNETMMVK